MTTLERDSIDVRADDAGPLPPGFGEPPRELPEHPWPAGGLVPLAEAAMPSPVWPVDGRQSAAAVEIARGAGRCLLQHGFAPVPEVTLATGRRADLCGVSDRGDVWIVEVKSSVDDFRVDTKWPEYRADCDRLYFAVASSFPRELIPDDVGLIIADRWHGEVVRVAPLHSISGARRKGVLTRIARAAAFRLAGVGMRGLE